MRETNESSGGRAGERRGESQTHRDDVTPLNQFSKVSSLEVCVFVCVCVCVCVRA